MRDGLRPAVNRLLESARGAGLLGSSLEAMVQIGVLPDGATADSSDPTGEAGDLEQVLAVLRTSAHPAVDNLSDWLLVSQLQIGGDPLQAPLAEETEAGLTVRVARASGEKCERCWHYEADVGRHTAHLTLCGRCVSVLDR